MLALAWFCLTGAISRLSRLVSRVYRSSLPKRPRWLTSLYQWCLTAIFLVITSLVLYWVGPDYLTPETADSLRLKTAEGSAVSPAWQTGLWQLIRWPVAVGMAGLGLGIFYRLSPQRWQRGTPLWPGIGLSLLLGCLGLSAGAWLLTYLNHQNLAYGVLLQLALILVGLLGIFLLIPLGAQFNVSLVNQQQISMPYSPDSPRFAAPPPSFDSFKIHRGPGDRFRE
jgi:uncharacterized BrkB/YihY/UPF0761 family membrane protein